MGFKASFSLLPKAHLACSEDSAEAIPSGRAYVELWTERILVWIKLVAELFSAFDL